MKNNITCRLLLMILMISVLVAGCATKSGNETIDRRAQSKNEEKKAIPASTDNIHKMKIAYFITRTQDDMFYSSVVAFAKKAAKDLDIQLDIYEAKNDHILMTKLVDEAINKGYNALMVINFKNAGLDIVKKAEENNIPILFENSGIHSEEIGKPREKYKNWIGEVLPDDYKAGYELANVLIKAQKATRNKVHMIAIEGQYATMASQERVKGLKKAVEENSDVVLEQTVAAMWDTPKAKTAFIGLKERYPEVSVVWTASDGMGLGVVEGCKEKNFVPGKDILTGGVDWTNEGINAVKNGQFVATAGGHFMEGAWGLIVLHDYLNGIDFKNEGLTIYTDMVVVTKDNIGGVEKLFNKNSWDEIDFKKFSKKHNKSLEKYKFNVEEVIKQLD